MRTLQLAAGTLAFILLASCALRGDPQDPSSRGTNEVAGQLPQGPSVQGIVTDVSGEPVSGARVKLIHRSAPQQPGVRSNAEGKFEIRVSARATEGVLLVAADEDQSRLAAAWVDFHEEDGATVELDVVLREGRRISVQVTDEEGYPLADAQVGAAMAGRTLAEAASGSDGKAVLRVPRELPPVHVWTRKSGYVPALAAADRPGVPEQATVRLVPMVPVTGRILDGDGAPAVGARLYVSGDGYERPAFRGMTTTNEDGTFQLLVYPEQYYAVVAQRHESASSMRNFLVRKGQPVDAVQLSLEPATRIHGRITTAARDRPLADTRVILYQRPEALYTSLAAEERLPNPTGSRDFIQPVIVRFTQTDTSGRFEFFAGPGRYYLLGPASSPIRRFTVQDEPSLKIDLVARAEEEEDAEERLHE